MARSLCSLLFLLTAGLLLADDWSAEDDTFDPSLPSVVIGDRSWIGDPSPFVHAQSSRTGYTHVNATNYPGLDPAVQLSLMLPLKAGETQPPGGGMLLLNEAQTRTLIKAFTDAVESKPGEKPEGVQIETSLEGAIWSLTAAEDDETRVVHLENKLKEKTHRYRFSVNASKKLLGAIKHSLEKLDSPAAE
ncbi:hypothetical protein Enr13x_08910 [Stieleria neptunia]|uniref:Uncharacterized protein n=1 Tax=Stieleria neptunia TaxID=2527979 RepID=A0A518HJP4_9BACT|nr:hypothetical protein [Stieleria neptunia]QDV41053.1 hypothetical protein Enr13x_08910 [Stieleria neptunia]